MPKPVVACSVPEPVVNVHKPVVISPVPEPVVHVPQPVVISPVPQLVISNSTVEAVSGIEGVSCQVEAVDDISYSGKPYIPMLTEENFVQWREKVISALKSEGLWTTVSGEEHYVGADFSSSQLSPVHWRSNRAVYLILRDIPCDHALAHSLSKELNDPVQLWKVIVDYFESSHIPAPDVLEETNGRQIETFKIASIFKTFQMFKAIQFVQLIYGSNDHSLAIFDSAAPLTRSGSQAPISVRVVH